MYRSLDAAKIAATVTRLRDRVQQRFPQSSLAGVAEEFVKVAAEADARYAWLARPQWWLRGANVLLTVVFLAVLGSILLTFKLSPRVDRFSEFLQSLDAGLNTLILLGGGMAFLFTLEVRRKRRRALQFIHQLRSLAHIVDMHQLTKDPEHILRGLPVLPTSPARTMSGNELIRYLDYCGEMLSLLGKVAALCVQEYDDPVVLGAVDQVEDLTTGLSRKIWQKISIIDRNQDSASPTGSTESP